MRRILLLLLAILLLPIPANATGDAAAVEGHSAVTVASDHGGAIFEFRLRNTGDQSWLREGSAFDAVNLGVAPDHAASPFFDDSTWHSPNRIAMVETAVAPGEMATFRFAATFPEGQRRTQLRLVREHVGFFGPTLFILSPGATAAPATKKVEIDLRTNTLTMWEGDTAIAVHRISAGAARTPTPSGTFKIQGKANVAYSKAYKLYMPYWNSIGRGYGIHGLPYWKRGSRIIVEGASHIGRNVSHGCVRLPAGADRQFYEWAENGTTVWIHR